MHTMKKPTRIKWKKCLALFLVFALVLQLAGCGASQNAPNTANSSDTNSGSTQTSGSASSESSAPDSSASADAPAAVELLNRLTSADPSTLTEGERLFLSQSGVNTELTESSIGANAELMATFEQKADVTYTLDPADFGTCFELEERESDSWTPFIGSSNTTFTVSDDSIIKSTIVRKTIQFTAKTAGECTITATSGSKEAVALVRVLAPEIDDSANAVAYYFAYLVNELEPLDDAARAEYLLNLADYAAILQADKKLDGTIKNALAAACLLYPNSYLINNYASILMVQKQYKEALLWLAQADEADPNNPVILTNMAECCYELGDYEMTMVYTDIAIASQEDFGLAHLLQACVHLMRGNVRPAMVSLFRSARTCWTDLTTTLMEDLYQYAKEYKEVNDIMILDKELLDILMEAAGADCVSDGRDTLANQISLPFPAPNISMALNADDSYWAQSQQILESIEPLRSYNDYEGTLSTTDLEREYNDDVRHVLIAKFHILYYEHLIEQWDDGQYYVEERDRLRNNFQKHYEETWAPIGEKQSEWYAELEEHANLILAGFGLSVVDDKAAAELILRNTEEFWTKYEEYMEESLKMNIDTQESLRDQWHNVLIQIENEKVLGYESKMKPILEEYYQRMNAILGYMQSDVMRQNFEYRVLWTVNYEGIVSPLQHAGASLMEVNKYDEELESWRAQLDGFYSDQQQKKQEEVQAKAEEAKLKEAQAIRREWNESMVIGLPPFSPIQVNIGMNGDNLVYGYGAFGHEIMYERDFKTGGYTETITTTTSYFPWGLDQLDSTIRSFKEASEVSNLLSNLNDKDLAKFARGKVLGGIPTFDADQTTGTVYSYDKDGNLIDRTKITKKTVGGSWGLIGGALETTTERSTMHTGPLTNPVRTSTKVKAKFGGLAFDREVVGTPLK